MKKLMIAISALALAVTSSAAQFFLKADATDLSLAESYSAGVLPGAGDEIVLDSGATYIVNDAALAVINGVRELWLDNQTVVELDVADGSEITAGIRAFEGKVVKKNAGTVATKGTFSAALDVNAGRMKIRNLNDPKQMSCKYFRFSIAQIGRDGLAAEYKGNQWKDGNGANINLRQFCLYAADGTRQNDGLRCVNEAVNTSFTEYTELPAGSCAYDNSMVGRRNASNYALASIFDSTYNNMVTLYIIDGSGPHRPDPSDPASWNRIVMRLKDDAKPVTHFDFELGYIDNWDYNPITRFMLEASSDGANWQTVWSNVDGDKIDWNTGSKFPWLSGSTTMAQYDTAKAYDADYAYNVDVPIETVTHPYKWFRYSIAKLGNGADGRVWNNVRQFCLYSKDGARQNGGLTLLNDVASGGTINAVSEIPAGCAAWDEHMDKWSVINQEDSNAGNNALATLLGSQASKMAVFFVRNANGNVTPKPADSSTWISFVMHLADGAKPVTHFDFELGYTTDINNKPTRFQLEGSLDGKVWDVVWSNLDAESDWVWTTTTAFEWMSGLSANGTQGSYLNNETYNPNGPLNLTSSIGSYHDACEIKDKYFRFSIAQIGKDGHATAGHGWNNRYGSQFTLRQFCLYAKDGSRQNDGLVSVNDPKTTGGSDIAAYTELPAGSCAYDNSMKGWKQSESGLLANLFNGSFNDSIKIFIVDGAGPHRPDPSNPATWNRIVMRLANSAKPVTHFDFELGYADFADNDNHFDNSAVSRFMIESSPDGVIWKTVWSNVDGDKVEWNTTGSAPWLSGSTVTSAYNTKKAYDSSYAYNLTDDSVDIVPYKWFRYRIAQIGTGGHDLNVRQLGLYAKDGTHVNLGLKAVNDAVPSASDPATDNPNYHYTKIPAADEIPAGCCAWDANVVGKNTYWDMSGQKNNPPSLARMFTDEGSDPPMSVYNVSLTPDPNNESSWIGIIMHLADDAQPVTHFDLCAGYTSNSSVLPTRMQLEASLDGKDWVVVWSNVEGDMVTWNVNGDNPFSWLSGNTDRFAYWKNPKPYVEGDFLNTYSSGMELTKETVLDSVKLGAGATLAFDWETYDLDAITVGVGAAATLENAWLAGEGVLTVEGLSRRGGEFSYPMLKDCIGSFASWSVVLDGINPAKYDVVVSGSKVTVTRKQGTMLLIK